MNTQLKKCLLGGSFAVYAALSASSAFAADTEIFFRDPPEDAPKPNLLFIMSTGGTMNGGTTAPDGCADSSKIGALKCILKDIVATEDRVNVGLMRFSGPGGPVLYPITDLGESADPVPVTNYITNTDNDLTQDVALNTMTLNGTSIDLGTTGHLASFRFEDVNIPQGATVTNARVVFTASDSIAADQSTAAQLDIYVENSADAAPIDTVSPENIRLSGRTVFTAVNWDLTGDTWTVTDGDEHAAKSTPEITTEINSIVNMPGWCGGNDINVFILPDALSLGVRTIETSDSNTDYAPRLYIEWDDSSIDAAMGEGCFQNTVGVTLSADDDAEDSRKNASTVELSSDTSDLDFYLADGSGAAARNVEGVGLLFKNLNIPNGADITEAYFELEVKTSSTAAFETTIGAIQDPAFSAWANEFSTIAVGANTVTWDETTDVDGNGTADGNWVTNQTIRSPDISDVIEELVGLGTWANDATNNNIALQLKSTATTTRIVKSADAAAPARLFVSYSGNYTPAATTVRQEVSAAIDDYKLVSNQPTVETYLEGYEYYTGGEVNFGAYRGSPTRTTNRVSHPDSYQDGVLSYGSVANQNACEANYPEDNACKEEVIVQASNAAGAPAVTYIKPETAQCQSNNIVYLSDGEPSPLDPGTKDATSARYEAITGTACSDNDGTDCSVALAEYLANNDIDPSVLEDQIINTHAIHFGAINDNKEAYGKAIAAAGDGMYLQAVDGPALEAAFELLISSLAKVNTSFVSAGITVNQSNRLTHRDELYFSLFRPESFASWPGNVKRYRIFGGQILDSNDEAAIVTNADIFKDDAQSWWSAEEDGNDAGKGGAAEQLDFTASPRVTFSNLTGNSNITPAGNNLVNTANATPGGAGTWESYLGTADATSSTAVLSWIMGKQVDVDTGGNYTVTADWHNQVGDPLHSKPTILTYRQGDGAGGTTEFDMVFVGTNHGFLHAFYTNDGTEEWSFIPKELLNNVKDYVDNAEQDPAAHEYGVDGSISIYIDDLNGDGAVDIDDGEKVYLYVGLRRGGSSYYAFDVTDHDLPKLMFVISDPNPATAGDAYDNLGQTWSKPVIAKLATEAGSLTDDDGTKYELAMVFGGGYDTNQDPTVANPDGGAPSVDTLGDNIFIANALTGAKIWDAQSNAQQYLQAGSISLMNSVPGDVKAIDPRKPGYFEHLYAADTLGQVFRFDLDTTWDGSDADTLAQGGMLAEIQTAADGTSCSAESCNRRFYYTPDISIVPRPAGKTFVSVALGSGYRARPLGLTNEDHFYVIRDTGVLNEELVEVDGELVETGFYTFTNNDGTAGAGAATEVIKLANLVNITNMPSGSAALDAIESTVTPKAGFYLALEEGEKVLAESLTFNNRVIFTTYIPPDSDISACTPQQGSGRAYAIDIEDGQPAVDVNNDGTLTASDRYIDLNNIGIPPEPQVIVLGNGPELLVGRQLATELIDVDWGEMDRIKWRERYSR